MWLPLGTERPRMPSGTDPVMGGSWYLPTISPSLSQGARCKLAGHGFFYYHTPMYRPEAAMDGWAKVFTFFSRHLSS